MAETQSGLAVVWGVQGITFTAGITDPGGASALGQKQSLTFTRASKVAYVANDLGESVGRVDFDANKVTRLTVIPSHATAKATAKTNMDSYLPAPGTKITIADADGAVIDGDYKLNSATLNKTNNGPATIDIEIEKFDANDITTVIS